MQKLHELAQRLELGPALCFFAVIAVMFAAWYLIPE